MHNDDNNIQFPVRPPKLNIEQGDKAMAGGLQRAILQMGYEGLRDVQKVPVEAILYGRDILFIAPTSSGKCLGKGTPVMLASGEVIPVEDIKAGDTLMGPDGSPREVISICRGREELFQVNQVYGDPYVVNRSHILSLKITGIKEGEKVTCAGERYSSWEVANVQVTDYLEATKTFRHVAKGWKSPGVEFDTDLSTDPDMPPYMLGVWLGDGHISDFSITTPDPEIEDAVRDYAATLGHKVTVDDQPNRCPSYHVSVGRAGGGIGRRRNRASNALTRLGLLNSPVRFIPDSYKYASKADRMALFAGLLDTDGYKMRETTYEYTSKHERLARDIVFLARSLGVKAVVKPCRKECNNTGVWGDYWRIYISGVPLDIPMRVSRKISEENNMRTNPLMSAVSLESIGEGDYYGFEVSGPDRLFLLGDFTVTHNTAVFTIPILALNWKGIVFSPLQALMRDQVDEMRMRGISADFINSTMTPDAVAMSLNNWANHKTQILYVAPERINRDDFQQAMSQVPPDAVIIDEAHCLSQWGTNFRSSYYRIGEVIEKFNPKSVIAVTATCTEEIADDICRVTGIPHNSVLWQYYKRKNLSIRTHEFTSDLDIFYECERINDKTIIYFATKKELERFAPLLGDHLNEPVGVFHGDINKDVKAYLQDSFKSGEIRYICATNAFGLGINVPDVRAVIHRDPPGTPEAYAQEAGRAGRDEKDSECIIFHHDAAWRTQHFFVKNGNPEEKEIRAIYEVLYNVGKDGGIIRKTVSELANMAGVQSFSGTAVIETLKAYRVIQNVESTDRVATISFTGSSGEPRFNQYKELIIKGGQETDASFISFSLDWLRQQLGVGEPTVTRWLKQWQTEGLIQYNPPFAGQPRILIGDLSNIDFAALKRRADKAWWKLEKMQEFVQVPDHDKQDWLEEYFDKWTP